MKTVTALRDLMDHLSDSDRAFAQSLLDQSNNRGLSQKQIDWVDRLVARATRPKPDRVDVSALLDFLHDAKVRRPVLFLKAGEQDIRISVAGPGSRTPGYVIVTSGHAAFEDRTFFGRISPDGEFEPALAVEPVTQTAIVAVLKAMADDPGRVAAEYGRLTGECCFCKLPLSDERSLEVGYGRICARKYGLPYGAQR